MECLFANADPISGGAGWIGAGLLGLVLCWLLLKHLPDKDRQMKEMLDLHDKRVDTLILRHDQSLSAMRATFEEALDHVIAHCMEETTKLREHFSKRAGEL